MNHSVEGDVNHAVGGDRDEWDRHPLIPPSVVCSNNVLGCFDRDNAAAAMVLKGNQKPRCWRGD